MATLAKDDNVRIDRLSLGPFGSNAYIITCQKTFDSAVVDAPGESGRFLAREAR
jgi:hypothetical protein